MEIRRRRSGHLLLGVLRRGRCIPGPCHRLRFRDIIRGGPGVLPREENRGARRPRGRSCESGLQAEGSVGHRRWGQSQIGLFCLPRQMVASSLLRLPTLLWGRWRVSESGRDEKRFGARLLDPSPSPSLGPTRPGNPGNRKDRENVVHLPVGPHLLGQGAVRRVASGLWKRGRSEPVVVDRAGGEPRQPRSMPTVLREWALESLGTSQDFPRGGGGGES